MTYLAEHLGLLPNRRAEMPTLTEALAWAERVEGSALTWSISRSPDGKTMTLLGSSKNGERETRAIVRGQTCAIFPEGFTLDANQDRRTPMAAEKPASLRPAVG